MKVGIKLLATQPDGSPIDPEEFEQELDEIVDEATKLEGVLDADIGATLSTGELEIWVTVETPNPDEAWPLASNAVRCAIHAAGGSTPGWPAAEEVEQAESGFLRRKRPHVHTWAGTFQGGEMRPRQPA
jgi:hypothetical protein